MRGGAGRPASGVEYEEKTRLIIREPFPGNINCFSSQFQCKCWAQFVNRYS